MLLDDGVVDGVCFEAVLLDDGAVDGVVAFNTAGLAALLGGVEDAVSGVEEVFLVGPVVCVADVVDEAAEDEDVCVAGFKPGF